MAMALAIEMAMATHNTPTGRALAAALGLSPSRITRLRQMGMPATSIEAAQAWVRAHIRPRAPTTSTTSTTSTTAKPTRPGDSDVEDFQAARTRRETAEASLAEMRLQEQDGELIRLNAVRNAWATRLTAVRDALLQMPSRIAPMLAAESSIERCAVIVDTELRQVLIDITTDGAAGTTGRG